MRVHKLLALLAAAALAVTAFPAVSGAFADAADAENAVVDANAPADADVPAAASAPAVPQIYRLWELPAPGETSETTPPTCEVWLPERRTSDACVIVCPGGGFRELAYDYEGKNVAKLFNERGIAAVVLLHRVPRREGVVKHLPAWQDAQRCVRFVRAHATEWGLDPEKIGVVGFSSGGCVAALLAYSSQRAAYPSSDALDEVPRHVNFAVPAYSAYLLEDGIEGVNTQGGVDSPIVEEYYDFDDHTPPSCFIHGDDDPYSPLGSIAFYARLRRMNVPCEMHIYAKTDHGFAGKPTDEHVDDWINRVCAWLRKLGY